MKRPAAILFVLILTLPLQACETAKGLKKDATYIFSSKEPSKEYKENWIYKADQWIRENMW